MTQALARTLSILGHPLLVLPAAAVIVGAARGQDPDQRWLMLGVLAGLGLLIQGWSAWQVRRGRWQHVDASQREERRGLNQFLLALLPGGAAWFVFVQPVPPMALGIGCAAAMVAAGVLMAPWLKLSLHSAFAVFSAILLWALGPVAVLAGLVFALAVAWSRWALGRHRRRELVAGAAAGATVGALFWMLLPRLG